MSTLVKESSDLVPLAPSSSRLAIAAALVGNTLEWFDIAVYGYFALVISKLFFPLHDETTSLLVTVATLGVGFVMRPVGALILGQIGDTHGRKAALSVTILLMAFGTAMIGFAPTYARAGLAGPVIIVLARLIQGFSAGGEMGSATAFLIEQAPLNRRGYFASWQQASQGAVALLCSLFGVALTTLLSHKDLEAWGWRLPFLFGLLVGPVGWYLRSRIRDDYDLQQARVRSPHSPLKTVLTTHRHLVLAGIGLTLIWTVCTYFFLLYMPTYATRTLGMSQSTSFKASILSSVVMIAAPPFFGWLSDKLGRAPLLIGFAIAILFTAYPALALLAANPSGQTLALVQLFFAILISGYAGTASAALAVLFPIEVRSTGVSISYSLSVTIFGSFAPFIATWLIATTKDPLSPAWYVSAAAALSLGSIVMAARAKYL
jgi:MHS family proline/betaine transporter-like MFS transporter